MRSQRSSLSRLSTVLATVPSDAKENLISKTILHYRVLERLGSGGMGVVYKAKDQKLRRYVALKFISEPLVSDLSVVRRFKQEARAASKLNHPNICTIYEINQHRGKPFIAMELIEGDSLKELIRRRQSLSIERIVAIAIQTIDALAEAHAKGIVHRDVKPANIFVNGEDIVKLVDFGLAKPILGSVESSGTTARLGDSGGVAGTYYYMSPEQALGRPLDGRSDLFAFGVVLYEMSTGRMPFEGQTLAAVFDGILNRRPVPPSRLNSEIPPALEAIVNKALQKDIHLRYQTASELRSDLVRLQSGSVPRLDDGYIAEPKGSIAVMPFVNASPDPNDEYFADGLAEEVMNALTLVPGLRVVSRTSVYSLKDKGLDVRDIGQKLNVTTILEGSVRRFQKNWHITVRLVNAHDGYQLWSQTYHRRTSAVFDVQQKIARSIVDKLRTNLGLTASAPVVRRQTNDLQAYSLYLQGRFHWNKRTEVSQRKSIRCYRSAIARDPGYALAYSGLADAHISLDEYGRARKLALKAIVLDDSLAEAHTSFGLAKLYTDCDWIGSESAFRRALNLNPNYATGHHWYALYLEHALRFDEAIREIHHALDLDPLSLIINSAVARIYLHAGRLREAAKQTRLAIDLDGSFFVTYLVRSWIFRKQGKFNEAVEACEKAFEVSGGDAQLLGDLGQSYALAGRRKEAQRILKRLCAGYRKNAASPYRIAAVYAGLGNPHSAFRWLDRARQESAYPLIDLVVDTRFDPLRSHPRFAALLERFRAPLRPAAGGALDSSITPDSSGQTPPIDENQAAAAFWPRALRFMGEKVSSKRRNA